MSNRIFTKKQIETLSSNKCVSKCSERSITYSTDFKINAVKLYEQGLSSREIFVNAGFDLNIIGRKQPGNCMKRWRRRVRKKGVQGLSEARGRHNKGGRPKTKDLTDKGKIEYLEAQVAYLKAENDFLAKLRAKRME